MKKVSRIMNAMHGAFVAFAIMCASALSAFADPTFTIEDGVLTAVELNGATEVVIPSGVTSIGDFAFCDCRGLTNVTMTGSVTNIGNHAFLGCSELTNMTIPDGVTRIGDYAFRGCSGLVSVTIPDSVTSIGRVAFGQCDGLTSVTISDSVTSIGEDAFYACGGLMSILVADGNANYSSVNNLLLTKDGKTLIQGVNGDVTIPDGVTIIGSYAFHYRSGLTSVTIPNSVTSIGADAFYGCSGLTSVTIPDSVTSIGGYAFGWCEGLTNVTIPDSVTSIGNYAFAGTALAAVHVVKGDTDRVEAILIGSGYDVSGITFVEDVIVPGYTVTFDANGGAINGEATAEKVVREGSTIGSLSSPIKDGYDFIGWYTAAEGGEEVTAEAVVTGDMTLYAHWEEIVPEWYFDITEDGNAIITGYSIRLVGDIEIPASIVVEEDDGDGNVTEVTYPVIAIGEGAFYGMWSSIASMTIPSCVVDIGDWAFGNWTGLTNVTIPNSVTSIGECAFYGCSGLASVTIPDSVTSIGGGAFGECGGLTSVTIPDSVTSIGGYAFSSCSRLMSILVADGNANYSSVNNLLLTKDGKTLIQGVNGDVTIPDGVTIIWSSAFDGRRGLTSVTIPNSVTNIGEDAFRSCSGLTNVTIPDSVTSIGNYAFYRCSGLTSVTIPDNVTSIGYHAFYGCSGLTSVTIPDSVTSIGNYAFAGTALAAVHVVKGDTDRVEAILIGSGYDVSGITFVEDVIVPGYTVTFDANGGAINGEVTAEKVVREGSTIGSLPIPIRSGYAFLGWFTAAEGGTQVTAETVMIGDMTVYAHWEEIVYTYNYIDNGDGTVTLSRYDENGYWVDEPISPMPVGEFEVPSEIDGKPVVAIGYGLFRDSKNITSVIIPASVTNIGSRVFHFSYGLTNITVLAENPAYKSIDGILYSKDGRVLVCCPYDKSGEIVISEGTEIIGSDAFENNRGVESVVFPEGLLQIADYAFWNCNGLTDIVFPTTVTTVGNSAFGACYGVTNIVLNEGLLSVGYGAFGNRTANEITLPTTVTDIRTDAFICDSGDGGEVLVNAPWSLYGVLESEELHRTWYVDENGPHVVTTKVEVVFYGDEPNFYTVGFDVNDGDALSEDERSIIEGRAIGSLPVPTKSGYAFLGWFTAAEGGTQVTADTVVTGDMTVYAHWAESPFSAMSEEYPWTVDGDGNWRNGEMPSWASTWAEVTVEGPCKLSFRWMRVNGYMSIFVDGRWVSGGGESGVWNDFSTSLIGEGAHVVRFELGTSLYSGMPDTGVYYKISDFKAALGTLCTVSLDANGGVWRYDEDGDDIKVISDFAGVYLDEPVPASQSLEFSGWWTSIDDSGEEVGANTLAEDGMTLYAHWQERESEPEWYYDYIYEDETEENATGVAIAGYSVDFAGALEIPSEIDGLPVVAITEWAFEDRCMTSVTIPASVTRIEDYAFAHCRHLQAVTFDGGESAVEMNKFIAFAGTPWLPHPDNDEYEDAQVVEGVGGSVEGTLTGATIADNDCIWRYGDAERTVWYMWVAPFTGMVVFSAEAANGRSDLLYLVATHGYDEENHSWDDCGYDWGNRVFFNVQAGETYYVSLATWNYVVNEFTLSWRQLLPPGNDAFADATTISGVAGSTTGTNIGASIEEGEPLPLEQQGSWTFETTASVWWKWTAPKSGSFTFTTHGSDFDTVLGIYSGSVVYALESLASNDESSEDDGTSLVSFDAVAGTTYHIAVGGYYTRVGNITLSWSCDEVAIPKLEEGDPASVTNAIAEAGFADAGVMEAIGGSAEEYNAFKDWAASVKVAGSASGDVAAGEAAVVANTNAAAAYLLGAERLFENKPKVEFGEIAVVENGTQGTDGTGTAISVAVTVRDGEEAVKCAEEKVAAMFEATSDLNDWAEGGGAAVSSKPPYQNALSVEVEVEEPVAGDSAATMRFKVTPGDGTAPRAFLRIRK